ncbi:manganese transport protein of NRAMP family [Corynebacterium resistens DSM 45100]|uniref:Manganese transport protein of NRAMP family n=1 Tax=Corynebacterium resistens (strain DSM 45100 / JCM 12819 / GTC 2026 / SICGH 158) TaxID=662755 RepID=F8DYU4_CORRG|nr:manganese transport protein of NRAMP family [Corynebacterium resistens DSM 45100]
MGVGTKKQREARVQQASNDDHPRIIALLGPAFVAAIAYVDPGNVAANLSAGAEYGYLLLWVLVLANLMAMLVQYLSAKLGLVTGRSLTSLVAESLGKREHSEQSQPGTRERRAGRLLYWAQAEIVTAATDIAEVIGGATALYLLFGTPPLLGGVIVGAFSLALLALQSPASQRRFEFVIMGFLAVITLGFLAGLFFTGLSIHEMATGIIPRFQGAPTVVLAASMLGATVMPHAIYLHSGLVRDREFRLDSDAATARHLTATRWDVAIALVVAGSVNIGMLCLAAEALQGVEGTDSIEGAHRAVTDALGPVVGALFGLGLLASGLASTSVGCYAGDMVMKDLLRFRIPVLWRRFLTLLPALVLLGFGAEPTWALIVSQVVLSLGIPFALIPLVLFTARRSVMGRWTNARALTVIAVICCTIIIALNIALVYLTATGAA